MAFSFLSQNQGPRGLLIRKVPKIQIGDLADIDCVLEESHSFTNMVTDHPVENGAHISDHSRPEPDKLTMRCFISNTPLSEEQAKDAKRSLSKRDVTVDGVTFQTTAIDYIDGRAQNALAKLEKMRQEGALITVATALKTYGVKDNEGMMIESISIPVTKESFDGLEFTLSLKMVKLVTNRTTKVRRDKRTGKKKNLGDTALKGKGDFGPQRDQSRADAAYERGDVGALFGL
jgi:hypothetical protein